MSLKRLLSEGCLSDKSERNREEELQRDREEGKRGKGGKKRESEPDS